MTVVRRSQIWRVSPTEDVEFCGTDSGGSAQVLTRIFLANYQMANL